MLLVGNQRAMYIDRHFPAKRLVETVVFRRRGQILISTDYVGDSHQMVVYHIRKVVGGISVGLDQDHVVQLRIVYGDIAVNIVMEGGGSGGRIILADNKGYARCQLRLYLFLRQMQTVLIIYNNLLTRDFGLQGLQALLVAEAVISLAFFNQLFRVLHIDACRLALTLHIGAYASVLVRTLVMLQARFLHGTINDIDRALHIALLVGILDTKQEISVLMLGNQICVQRRS